MEFVDSSLGRLSCMSQAAFQHMVDFNTRAYILGGIWHPTGSYHLSLGESFIVGHGADETGRTSRIFRKDRPGP